ncbi:MAG: TonB-dependent receptor [Porticoccaceae bacterium]
MTTNHSAVRAFSRSLLVSAVATAALAGAAQAQDAPRRTLEEIVVTARKVEESIQSTPVAVSAMTGEGMRVAQIRDVKDVQRSVPNLSISTKSPASGAMTFIAIRGQSGLAGTLTADPAIGVYMDGVYVARHGASLADLVDVQRVEVLRGPQGTLFGRNTTGGALNITSNAPTDVLEGSVEVQLGNYEQREVTGIINVPLTENLAARVAYQHSEHEGYGDNDFLGKKNLLDSLDNDFARVSLKYTAPSGNWDLTLVGDYTDRTGDGQLTVMTGLSPSSAAIGYANAQPPDGDSLSDYLSRNNDFWTGFANERQPSSVETRGLSATVNVDLGWAAFKSITAWRDMELAGLNDSDGTPYRLLSTRYDNEQRQVSQEFQLSGGESELRWIVGAMWFEEKATDLANSINFLRPGMTENNADAVNTSRGMFGQLYYDVTDTVTLTAGLRHTMDRREVVIKNLNSVEPQVCAVAVEDRDDGVTCKQSRDTDFDYWSYMLGADWQVSDDIFLYAKTSRAFMAGGWNNRQGSIPAFEPERVRDFEIGAKVDWLDGTLRTNIALFRAEQDGLQRTINTVSNNTPAQFIVNAGSSTVQGAEFEISALPWEGMELRASVGLMDAEYDKFQDERLINGEFVTVDRSREEPRQTPELTYSIAATQRVNANYGTWLFHADYSYMGKHSYISDTASPGASEAEQARVREMNKLGYVDSYGLLNAKIGLELHNSGVSFELWARNLTEEKYFTRTFADLYTGPFGYALGYTGDPRTFGVTARYEF